jgi:hypothetical protein
MCASIADGDTRTIATMRDTDGDLVGLVDRGRWGGCVAQWNGTQ